MVFAKLIFSRQNFFCSEKRFLFSKIPKKKKFGGKKINLAQKFFTGFRVFSYFNFTLLWNCESVCVRKRFCGFVFHNIMKLYDCVIKSLK